jgi:hypothetical protein
MTDLQIDTVCGALGEVLAEAETARNTRLRPPRAVGA